MNEKNPLEGIHIKIHSPALKENNAIYRVGHLATKSNNATELDPGSSKSEEDQTIIMLLTTLALDAVRDENKEFFQRNKNIIDAQLYIRYWSTASRSKRRERCWISIQINGLGSPSRVFSYT